MLGKAVGGARIWELVRSAVLVHVRLHFLHHRAIGLRWMKRVLGRAFDGLVMLREGTVRHWGQRNKEAADALRVHDEWTHVVFGIGISLEVGHVIACPLPGSFIEPDLFAAGIPRLAIQ